MLLSIQSGEQTSRGLELESVANLAPGFKVLASHTYDLFVSKDLDPTLIGKVPTNTPRRLTSAWADYTFQTGALTGFGFGGGVRYVGPSYADNVNTLEVPSFVLGDAALHYEWQNWRWALNVANSPTRFMSEAARRRPPASTAIAAGSRRACRTNGSAKA